MDKLVIKGPSKISGEVTVSKAKNAYLPILAAVLLNDKPITLKNLPNLRDIRTMKKLLSNLGVKITEEGNDTHFDASNLESQKATYDLVKTMRASICVLGPLVSRYGHAQVSLPGGCAIGTRPIDLHLSNLEKLGAKIDLKSGYVEANTEKLIGAPLVLSFPSVGATENLMMAAVFAEGVTVIDNCALEPEVSDLGDFLNAMGANIQGIGTKTLKIEGVKSLKPTVYEAIGDRIEAGTYIMGALMCDAELKVSGFVPTHLEFVLNNLKDMGANLEVGEDFVLIKKSKLKATKVDTAPYPGFPTDLQAQMMALMTQVDGASIMTEHIFENRFMHVPELQRLGADIVLKGNSAIVTGGNKLIGAPVMCTDLRASAALFLAAMVSEGTCDVLRVYHLDRGYDNIDSKLIGIGVDVERKNED